MATVCTECYETHGHARFYGITPQAKCAHCGKSCLGYTVDDPPPEPCYAADVDTLREMLAEERERLTSLEENAAEYRAKWGTAPLSAALVSNLDRCKRRIDALATAIEVMGGAL